ncbi:MAG: cytochrome B [Legionella sp.]|nr:MAG: cytochrome B [Legionella sp.]
MKQLRVVAFIAMVLAFAVILLGAYTRLTDAGLGCPDWPGCYGRMVLPAKPHDLLSVQQQYPDVPLESRKAWTEMGHRYAAGLLALLIACIGVYAWRYRQQGAPKCIPMILLGLVGFQAALGMWTVTLKLLPIVVMGHLLGGLLIFGHLVYLNLLLRPQSGVYQAQWRLWVDLAVVIVFCQIALGGWVSSNYAGLACIGFPQCNGQLFPSMAWHKGFQLWSSIGANHQGGLLDNASRVTIQMAHRFGAYVTLMYLVSLSGVLVWRFKRRTVRQIVSVVLLCLAIQVALGIGNVLYLLPLWMAVAHNGIAGLLFAAVLTLRYVVLRGERHVRRA